MGGVDESDTRARLGRLNLVGVAGFALGLPVIVIVTSVSGGTLRPFAPILLGGWVFVMIIVRLVIMYKVYVLGFRKQRQITGREIDRLEARIEDAQRKSGDKD